MGYIACSLIGARGTKNGLINRINTVTSPHLMEKRIFESARWQYGCACEVPVYVADMFVRKWKTSDGGSLDYVTPPFLFRK